MEREADPAEHRLDVSEQAARIAQKIQEWRRSTGDSGMTAYGEFILIRDGDLAALQDELENHPESHARVISVRPTRWPSVIEVRIAAVFND